MSLNVEFNTDASKTLKVITIQRALHELQRKKMRFSSDVESKSDIRNLQNVCCKITRKIVFYA